MPTALTAINAGQWRLAWRDEFDGTALDTTKWTGQSATRKDAQNTPDAATVRDGIMLVRAR